MENGLNPANAGGKKFLKVIVIVAVLAVAAIVVALIIAKTQNKNGKSTSTNSQVKEVTTTVKDVDQSKTPDFFPASMPSETGAKIIKNYNTVASDGRQLGTRVYITAKSVDENYKIFEDYFNKDGWQVTSAPPIKDSNSKTLVATKGSMQAQVTIGDDPTAKARTVAIIFTQRP